MLDVNPRTVRAWEQGRNQPSPSAVEALWGLCDQHDALVRFYRRQDLVRLRRAEGWPPRGWSLAAAGRALSVTPEIRVEWDDPDPDENEGGEGPGD
nr:MAG TPA: Helix-turn-helix protein [Caudoviricetes sp.]